MADPLTPVSPQRLRHGHGEALAGRDFADQAAQDDQLRWWHNRALHRAYGVSLGLTVELGTEPGWAVVAPGLAYDRQGRELVLRAPRRIAVPPGPQVHRLFIGYRAAGGPDGPVVLGWLPVDRPVGRAAVPLALSDGSTWKPPRARPMAAPRIGRGVVAVAGASWGLWTEPTDHGSRFLGVQGWIDTSAAGFTAVPCYFVQVTGTLWSGAGRVGLPLVPFVHVTGPTRDGFLLRWLLPALLVRGEQRDGLAIAFASRPALAVRAFVALAPEPIAFTWTGIQMQDAAPTAAQTHDAEQDR